jgi:murein L,D-transpeptidase YcbB/YkuD
MIKIYCRLSYHLILLIIPISFTACNSRPSKKEQIVTDAIGKTDTSRTKDIAVHGYFSEQQDLRLDSNRLNSFFEHFTELKKYEPEVREFYGIRKNLFAWYDSAGLTEQASNLFNHLINLDQEGVQGEIPYKERLDSLLNETPSGKTPDPDAEILLTSSYFYYADKVWKGIPENETIKIEWLLSRKKLNLPYLADSLLRDSTAALFSLDFNFRQYDKLKKQLQKYRHLDSTDSWLPLKAVQKVYKKTDNADLIADIRHRLFLLGDLSYDSRSYQFDDSLEAAVKSFQQRNGMTVDGNIGPGFFTEINTPLKENIRKLIVNMERTRWVPIHLSHHYFVINIPAFSMAAYDMDTVTFRMNVVVGKDLHPTVIFNGDIKYIVFSPYWNVPNSILKKEILPGIKKDPDYLQKHNMEWNGKTVRQKPGASNSLGLVKFLFPNSHNIYLHDSPAKNLFGESSRAFSHGCIRLAEPEKMAVYLLKDDPKWNAEKIHKAMHSLKEQYVTLPDPVPVYIAYLTAWVDNSGKLNFRKDIYNRDQRLEDMIMMK